MAQDETRERRGSFSQSIIASLVHGPDPPAAGDDAPLHENENSQQSNRERVRENQRLVALQLLQYSLPVVGCLIFLVVSILIASTVLYIIGWMVWSHNRDKPCDQPLKWWLLVMLVIPVLQCQCNGGSPERDGCRKCIMGLVMTITLVVGVCMCCRCKTCQDTNPSLYQFVKVYLIFQSTVWLLLIFLIFGLVSVIFWLHQHGLLESGPGPAMAAKPGLVHDIETVPYSPNLFSENDATGDVQPSECSICHDDFDAETPIKRTPCGHLFHEECLGTWLGSWARTCPLCRTDLEEALEEHASGPDSMERGVLGQLGSSGEASRHGRE